MTDLAGRPYSRFRRVLKDRVFTAVCILAALTSVVVLSVLLVSIGSQGYRYLLTRKPDLAELGQLDWTAIAEEYRAGRMEALDGLPDAVREQASPTIERVTAGLAALGALEWSSLLDSEGIEEAGDLERVDWPAVQAARVLPEAVAALGELDDDRWEELIGGQRFFSAGAARQFVTAPPSRKPERAGLGPAMWGSVWICAVCALTALPLGVGTAIFLEEYKPTNRYVRMMHGFLQLNISNLAGVPSIVYGIIGLTAFVQMFGFFGNLSEPSFTMGTPDDWYYFQIPFGRGVFAGGLTLMLVILPIVIISSQEALRAVPNSLREGALAAGATKWQMVWKMTLPAAVPGIMTGSILAMSRAIGEAAPILVIAGIVFIRFTPQHLMDEFTAMPLQIYDWAGRPQEAFHQVAATGIILLLAVLLTFNATAVFIRQRFQKPLQ